MMIQNGFMFAIGILLVLAGAITDKAGLGILGFSVCYFGGL